MTGTTGTPATRLHGGRIMGVGVFVVLLLIALVSWFKAGGLKTPTKDTAEMSTNGFTAKQLNYEEVKADPPPPTPVKVDTTAQQLALIMATLQKMQTEMGAMKNDIDALKKRPTSTTVIQQEAKKEGKKAPTPMLYVAHELKDPGPPPPTVPQYTLAPGGKIGCEVESLINSDVQGFFTAKVTTNVYDTATGRHLLVPQGSTIVAKDHSASLLYGNERIPTTSLTLTFPDGRFVELGQAPVTDQLGTMGLTGDVDNHFWRLFGAVFIGGALRGGAVALQSAAAEAGGAAYVVGGVGGAAQQGIGTQMGRAMDTRPTIKVYSGQLCNVLIIKPLQLQAMWQ